MTRFTRRWRDTPGWLRLAWSEWQNARRLGAAGTTREEELLAWVQARVNPGDPAAMLAAMDDYARQHAFLMNVGPDKGERLRRLLAERQPRRLLELGRYCGYSAILFAQSMPTEARLVSVDPDAHSTAVARALVDLAGLSAQVQIQLASAEQAVPAFQQPFDFVFIDHIKQLYLPDLQRLMQAGLLAEQAVVVADNTGIFARDLQPYLDYVHGQPGWRHETYRSTMEYQPGIFDAMELSWLP